MAFPQDFKIYACIMAGCDYLPSIKGIGLKTAIKYLQKYNYSADRKVVVESAL